MPKEISEEQDRELLRALKATGNAAEAARRAGVSRPYALRLAKTKEVQLAHAKSEGARLFSEIFDGHTLQEISKILGLRYSLLKHFASYHVQYSETLAESVIQKIKNAVGPDAAKAEKIRQLETLVCYPRQSADRIKKAVKKTREEYCEAAGKMLADLRQKIGISDDALPEVLRGTSILVQKNITHIEAGKIQTGSKKIDPTVYRSAIIELAGPNGKYRKIDRKTVDQYYKTSLEPFLAHLRR